MRRLLLSLFGAAALMFPLDLAAHDRYVAYRRPIVRVNAYGYRAYPSFRRGYGCHRRGRFFRHRGYYGSQRFGPVIIVPRLY